MSVFHAVVGMVQTATLVAIAVVDIRTLRIPNLLNLLLLLTGIAQSSEPGGQGMVSAGFSAFISLATFYLFARTYEVLRQRSGLGLGDVKFLGASGAVTGLANIPLVVMFAAFSGLAYFAGSRLAGKSVDRHTRIFFGPFLAAGLAITCLAGDPPASLFAYV